MRLKPQALILPGLTAAASIALCYALRDSLPGAWPSNGMALGALGVTLLTSFKADLFAFEPVVTGGDMWWVRGNVAGNGPHLAAVLQFRNIGYESGVIEQVRLFVRQPHWAGPRVFEPVTELDPVALTRALGIVNKETTRAPFTHVALSAKEVSAHTILFAPSHLQNEPDPVFGPGTCSVEVYVDIAGQEAPRRVLEFEHTLVADTFVSYANDISQFLPKSRFNAGQLILGAKPATPAG